MQSRVANEISKMSKMSLNIAMKLLSIFGINALSCLRWDSDFATFILFRWKVSFSNPELFFSFCEMYQGHSEVYFYVF